MNKTYLRTAMTVINTEEMHRRDLTGASRTSGSTSSDLITLTRHESRHHRHRILHLLPPSNLRPNPPRNTLIPPDAFPQPFFVQFTT
ncbi:hypothetical protein HanXRQr2_Chr09g0363041 [Helianthus annuus]|uniref:Uncharacterized protein n=1 Tax=Helianthus annuus TaxID=4232 RepID=A0A9K3N654_HELAN|nr:hypothetical protein HanXRQr2_Chr09g0363041 [Helianthus annuus]